MSVFTRYDAPLNIQFHTQASKILNRDYWVVTSPFVYRVGSEDSDTMVTVPTGYLTDGASVPRVFWSLVSPWGIYGQAAVLHDFLCEYGTMNKLVRQNGEPVTWMTSRATRKMADDIFNEAMGVLEVPPYKRYVMYKAVCLHRTVNNRVDPVINSTKKQLEDLIAVNLAQYGTTDLLHEQLNLFINQ